MNSSRPYLLRALYEWILDNNCTPYLLVNAGYPETVVPQNFVEDGQIVLNVSPNAVRQLEMDNARVTFDGRFGGVPQQVWLPVQSVMAIYARENGQGMVFEIEPVTPPEPPQDEPKPDSKATPSRPALKVVK
ncbi:ClpXP protease specificity-enhancing factor [Halopseudomonas nanhaiensis]|uniref:ClpXP protease specificity-enhancing factor n=1 Tax=Halopseudomonas nanhaiensis TaxID=2830842 RepID=UPI001CBFA26E|nr:ClpXP protease specificity-enhancing factor [Halopseudomonas nanhaiensis]UAW99971.1 ClpXP protease specificity-enhancing factor [Halopseudomonas nanhaiensis]